MGRNRQRGQKAPAFGGEKASVHLSHNRKNQPNPLPGPEPHPLDGPRAQCTHRPAPAPRIGPFAFDPAVEAAARYGASSGLRGRRGRRAPPWPPSPTSTARGSSQGRRGRAGAGLRGDSVTSGGGPRRGIPGLYQVRSWRENGRKLGGNRRRDLDHQESTKSLTSLGAPVAVGAVSKNRDWSLWDGFPSLVGALRRRGLRGWGLCSLTPARPDRSQQ